MGLDVSVLIATRDRPELLERTLEGMRNQEVGSLSWEVIVIDNGSSSDQTQILLAGIAEKWKDFPLVVLHEPTPGKSMALNRGLSVAKGKLLAFTDDDVIPARRWVASLVSASERFPEFGILCGPIVPGFTKEHPWMLRMSPLTAGPFGRFTPLQVEEEELVDLLPYGGNFAVRADVLTNIRFDEAMGPKGTLWMCGEDTAFLEGLIARGCRTLFVPSAGVKHFVGNYQMDRKWLLNRTFSMGRQTRPATVDRIDSVWNALIECKRLWKDFGSRVIKFEALSVAAESAGMLYAGWKKTGKSKKT